MFNSWFLRTLNREASSGFSQEVIEALKIADGYIIADVGAGGGYFTIQFAKKVGKRGIVFAVDVKQKFLDFVRQYAESEGIDNVVTVLVKGDYVELPRSDLDLVFCRNTFHHLKKQIEYFSHLRKFLKSQARVAIIENKRWNSFVGLIGHFTPQEVIRNQMARAGYCLVQSFEFLPKQSFTVWTPM